MAQIVLGLASSHSPQLSTPPEMWPQHGERDQRNPDLRGPDGRAYRYEELLAQAGSSMQKELTPDVWQTRYDACQRGLAKVSADCLAVKADHGGSSSSWASTMRRSSRPRPVVCASTGGQP